MGGTARKAIMVGLGLIALYLVLDNYTGFSKDFSAGATGTSTLVQALQARSPAARARR